MQSQPHLMEQLATAQEFDKAFIDAYDQINPFNPHPNPLFDNVMYCWEPFYKGNAKSLKKAYNITSLRTEYTGDREEPETNTYIVIWAYDAESKWGKQVKMQWFLQLAMANFNCCDRVCNPDPEYKETYGQPTPDNWAFDLQDSYIKYTDHHMVMRLTFHGHYHS